MSVMPEILRVDFDDTWTIRFRHPDGRECVAKFTPDAFKRVRECPMGQFLLLAWFSRASALPEAHPNPR